LNQDYCSSDHKAKENNWIARQRRQMVKPVLSMQLNNEKVLERFYKSGNFQITPEELTKAGYDFNAPTQQLNDALNKRSTRKVFNYGIQAIDQNNLRIVCFKNSIIKPFPVTQWNLMQFTK
jgi:hypothetical protein